MMSAALLRRRRQVEAFFVRRVGLEPASRRGIADFPGCARREMRVGCVRGGGGGTRGVRGVLFVQEHLGSFAEHHCPDNGGQHRNRNDDGCNHAVRALLGIARDVVSRGSGFAHLFKGVVKFRLKFRLHFAV